jgi:hypothetical protein
MADFVVRYPHARVIGVELDDVNAALARRNVEPWADRCHVVNAAVWSVDGDAWYFPCRVAQRRIVPSEVRRRVLRGSPPSPSPGSSRNTAETAQSTT